MTKMTDLMVDMETLATTADAVILSIGAVPFNLETGAVSDDGFYASVSIESNLEYKRRISEDTLIWWMKQPTAAQQVFHEPKMHLITALVDLGEFAADVFGQNDFQVWANGSDFDTPMLAHAMTQTGVQIPWKFWNARCFRTYKNLPGARAVPAPATGVKHNALSDAYNQAVHASAIHKALFQPTTKKVKA